MKSECGDCGEPVIHVRDDYTGATFPVDAHAMTLDGFTLEPPEEGRRNPRAIRDTLQVHQPHAQTCAARLDPPHPDELEKDR